MSVGIPKALKDDHLKDTVVSVFFETNFNRNYIHERIANLLMGKDGVILPGSKALDSPGALIYGLKNFRIRLDRGLIQFNCITNYPGWQSFGSEINRFLKSLSEILVYLKVQIRYISVFEGIRIFQHINGTINLKAFPPIMGEEYTFSVHIADDVNPAMTAFATVRLINDKPIMPQATASFVDISLESKTDNNSIGTVLEFIHKHEKLLFFTIITNEFTKSLGPTY